MLVMDYTHPPMIAEVQSSISASVYRTVGKNPDGSIVVTDGERFIVCKPRGDGYSCGGR